MESEFSVKQTKRSGPGTDYAPFLICQKRADSHSHPMQKLTDQGYPKLLRAIAIIKDNASLRLLNEVEPHSDFLEYHYVAPITQNC